MMATVEREYARSSKAQPPTPGELGRDGDAYQDVELGGPDLNPRLSGTAKYDVYDEMRKTDPAVAAALKAIKLPIRGAHWEIEPHCDDARCQLIAEAVRVQLGVHSHGARWLDQSWSESLHQALQFLDWGCMFEELVWGEPIDWTPPGSKTSIVIRPIVRLAPRKPQTLAEGGIVTDQSGQIVRLTQDLPKARPIPGEKLAWYVADREDGTFYGTSLLRAMYGPWRLKKALQVSSGIAFDRFAAGVPVVRYPAGGDTVTKRQADAIGRNYRTHERAWITLPGAPPPQGEWDVEILGGAHTMADPIPLLRHYDEQIALAALQEFTRLGVTETGSRAVGEVLAAPYYLALRATVDYVAEQRSRLVVRRFVDVNFGQNEHTPRLVVSKIGADDIEPLVSMVATLSSVGWNMSDPALVNMLRVRMGLPDLPPGEPTRAEGEGLAKPDTMGGTADTKG